jgi:hypothetical protein
MDTRKQINMGLICICMIFMLIEIKFDIDINNDELSIIIWEFHVHDIYINWN